MGLLKVNEAHKYLTGFLRDSNLQTICRKKAYFLISFAVITSKVYFRRVDSLKITR